MIPLLDLRKEFKMLHVPLQEAVLEVMKSGDYIVGQKVQAFEHWMQSYIGVSHAISVANGTDALLLALKAAGVGEGDEVITTSFTFFATAEAIVRLGAKPVFVDICFDTFNIDPLQIETVVTERTKAILVVHLFGQCADMPSIMNIAKSHQLAVIEDACQAMGARCHGRRAGSFGAAGCFSFYPTKNLGAFGDAGAIVTDDDDMSKILSKLRNHGTSSPYIHDCIGFNSRLDEIQAAILLVKFQLLDWFLERRVELADRYTHALQDLVITPKVRLGYEHTYHQYCVRCLERDAVRARMRDHGVTTGVYYPLPLHLQPALRHLGYREGAFPVAEAASREILALPMYPTLKETEQDMVIQAMQECVVSSR